LLKSFLILPGYSETVKRLAEIPEIQTSVGHAGRKPRHFCGRSKSFCTRQLSSSPAKRTFSDGHAIWCTHPNSPNCLPALPNSPRIFPFKSNL